MCGGGVCTQEYKCLQWSEEGTGAYGAGATCSCELPDMGLGAKLLFSGKSVSPLNGRAIPTRNTDAVHKWKQVFSVMLVSAVDICHPVTMHQLSLNWWLNRRWTSFCTFCGWAHGSSGKWGSLPKIKMASVGQDAFELKSTWHTCAFSNTEMGTHKARITSYLQSIETGCLWVLLSLVPLHPHDPCTDQPE